MMIKNVEIKLTIVMVFIFLRKTEVHVLRRSLHFFLTVMLTHANRRPVTAKPFNCCYNCHSDVVISQSI